MAASKRSSSRRKMRREGSSSDDARVVVENVNHPGTSRAVHAAKYQAMRRALLQVLPRRSPGLTLADTLTAVLPRLPEALFPASAHAGWWFKTVQLDLEAKRRVVRERSRPIRLHRAG